MSLTRHAIILTSLALLSAAIVTRASTPCANYVALNCTQSPAPIDTRLTGDWDYYVMLGAAPNGGFEARRRMGFAHFDGPYASGAWLKRRSGAPLYSITKVTVTGDNITLSLENGSEIVAVLKEKEIEGRIYRDGKPIDRIW